MDRPTLTLSMQPDWRREINLHKTPQYIHAMQSLDLDEHSECYFCGAQDGPYLELHHLDGDHTNYDWENNMVLACSLCHRYHHIGLLAYYKQAKSICLPNEATYKVNPIDLNIINRSVLMFQYLNPDKPVSELPYIKEINEINSVFVRYDSYDLWCKKIAKANELKEIREEQQKKIRDADSIKDEAQRKQALADIEEEIKAENEAFEEKHSTLSRDIKRISELTSGKELDRVKQGELLYLANGISLLSLAHALTKVHQASPEKFNNVIANHLSNEYGRFSVWYNMNVMQSLNGEYTVDQKMRYLIRRQGEKLRNRRNIG